MKFVICDDNVKIISKLEKIVSECFDDDRSKFECKSFFSAEKFMRDQEKKEKNQIYLLDIEMGIMSGVELAKHIRTFDEDAKIIFVTSHKEMMQEAFDVQAFHYLVKPLDEWKVKTVLLKAIQQTEKKTMFFTYRKNKKIYTCTCDEIILLESVGKKIKVELDSRTEEFYGVLKNIIEELDEMYFVRVHHSFIVNIRKVRLFEGEEIILSNGQRITVTKKYRKWFHHIYRNYIMMRSA